MDSFHLSQERLLNAYVPGADEVDGNMKENTDVPTQEKLCVCIVGEGNQSLTSLERELSFECLLTTEGQKAWLF